MMKMRTALLVVALFVVSLAVFAQSVRRDGKWEVKTEAHYPNSPNGPPETSIQIRCVTPKDIDDPYFAAPIPIPEQSECKFQHKVDGNKVTWSMQCPGLSGTGEFIYTANAYTGTFKLSIEESGQVTYKYSAKRLGDCDK